MVNITTYLFHMLEVRHILQRRSDADFYKFYSIFMRGQ